MSEDRLWLATVEIEIAVIARDEDEARRLAYGAMQNYAYEDDVDAWECTSPPSMPAGWDEDTYVMQRRSARERVSWAMAVERFFPDAQPSVATHEDQGTLPIDEEE